MAAHGDGLPAGALEDFESKLEPGLAARWSLGETKAGEDGSRWVGYTTIIDGQGRRAMRVAIQLTRSEEAKALPILLRHSPGMVLPNRVYVISNDAARALRASGVEFTELSRETVTPPLNEVGAGERV